MDLHVHYYARVIASNFQVLICSGPRDTTLRTFITFLAGPARGWPSVRRLWCLNTPTLVGANLLYLCENLVTLGKASVHVLLLGRQGHDVVRLEQPSGGVHELQRVVVWRRDDAPLTWSNRGTGQCRAVQGNTGQYGAVQGSEGKAGVQSFSHATGYGRSGYRT